MGNFVLQLLQNQCKPYKANAPTLPHLLALVKLSPQKFYRNAKNLTSKCTIPSRLGAISTNKPTRNKGVFTHFSTVFSPCHAPELPKALPVRLHSRVCPTKYRRDRCKPPLTVSTGLTYLSYPIGR